MQGNVLVNRSLGKIRGAGKNILISHCMHMNRSNLLNERPGPATLSRQEE